MDKISKEMALLKSSHNEKLVYLFLYYNTLNIKLSKKDEIGTKYKYSVAEIAKTLDIHRTNTWRYVVSLEKKGLIDVIKVDNKLEVIL